MKKRIFLLIILLSLIQSSGSNNQAQFIASDPYAMLLLGACMIAIARPRRNPM